MSPPCAPQVQAAVGVSPGSGGGRGGGVECQGQIVRRGAIFAKMRSVHKQQPNRVHLCENRFCEPLLCARHRARGAPHLLLGCPRNPKQLQRRRREKQRGEVGGVEGVPGHCSVPQKQLPVWTDTTVHLCPGPSHRQGQGAGYLALPRQPGMWLSLRSCHVAGAAPPHPESTSLREEEKCSVCHRSQRKVTGPPVTRPAGHSQCTLTHRPLAHPQQSQGPPLPLLHSQKPTPSTMGCRPRTRLDLLLPACPETSDQKLPPLFPTRTLEALSQAAGY